MKRILDKLKGLPSKHFGPLSFVFARAYLSILIPLCLLPILWIDPRKEKECRCLYVVLLMALYWVFQVIPLVVTSLIPLALYPLFEIQSTSKISPNYFTASNSLFLGGLIFAIAIEDSGLDRRMALSFLSITGYKPKALLFGIMSVTSFLSLLVSNTATTAMMIPILNSILEVSSPEKETHEKYKNGLLLAVAYSANIGGTGFLTGTPPNLVAPPLLDKTFGTEGIISFINWALFALPLMLVNLVLAGVWLYYFFGFSGYKRATISSSEIESQEGRSEDAATQKSGSEDIQKKTAELGTISFREVAIAFLFLLTVVLWFTKTPRVFRGWSSLFPDVSVASATPAFFMIILMFLLPRELRFWPFSSWEEAPVSSEALLTWKAVEKKLPWGIMFLLGGGTAMALGTRESGLSAWLVQTLKPPMSSMDPWITNFIFCVIMTFSTEFVSNTAAANILVPILVDLSISICESPLYLVVSTVICSSYAFMIPVATGPNALIFEASSLSQFQMMKCGLFMNLICICTTTLAINVYGGLIFEFSSPPDWLMAFYESQNDTNCLNITAQIL